MFQLSPLKAYCVTNLVAESYFQAASMLSGLPNVNLAHLYLRSQLDIQSLKDNCVDVAEDAKALDEFRQLLSLNDRFQVYIATIRQKLGKSYLGKKVLAWKHKVFPSIVPLDLTGPLNLRGEDLGFANIVECAAVLERLNTQVNTGIGLIDKSTIAKLHSPPSCSR